MNHFVLAGTNTITISPSGGGTNESNNIRFAATCNLTLSGNNVHTKRNQVGIGSIEDLKIKEMHLILSIQSKTSVKRTDRFLFD